jgi:hypothetical protein
MLAAHLVPGYFAVVNSQRQWRADWNAKQRVILWMAALISTFAPDLDVIYNTLFRGFANHSILWTHSLFVHLGIGLCWWLLRRNGRWPYLQTLVGLVAVGGLSHLVLDAVSHGTPLLYPVSLHMFGAPSIRVLEGGFWAYITDPIFLTEPFLLALVAAHWTVSRKPAPRVKKLALFGLIGGVTIFTVTFLLLLPTLQSIVATRGTG